MSEERKTSDILLSLELKIDSLIKYQQNLDLLLKTVLNKLNKLDPKISTQESSIISEQVSNSNSKLKQIPGIKPGIFLINTNENTDIGENSIKHTNDEEFKSVPGSDSDNDELDIEESGILTGKRRTARYGNTTQLHYGDNPPIPIQQKIVYASDNKNVIQANITIINSNGDIVKELKTAPNGKWITSLIPGSYSVRIQRRGSNGRQDIDKDFSIEIQKQSNNDKKVVQLETLEI
jgi:hypothetical protein